MSWKKIFLSHNHKPNDIRVLLDHSHPDPQNPLLALYTTTPEGEVAALKLIKQHERDGNFEKAEKIRSMYKKIKDQGAWIGIGPWEGMFEDSGGPAREQLTIEQPKPTPPQTFGYL